MPLLKDWPITLDIGERRVRGNAACNSYEGKATIAGSSFDASAFFVTEIGCAPRVMSAQDRYLAALQQADSIAREDENLILTGDRVRLAFRRVSPPPTAALVATTWRLESLVLGRGPQGLVSSAVPARLVLARDGRLHGSTGCRRFTGRWVESGNEIVATSLSTTGDCRADLAEQDAQVLDVLGDGFTARIEGQELTVFATRGDRGLIYRAKRS